MFILGISAFYHDSAASLLYNETIVAAAQEERFSRIKNDSQFPSQTIVYCLRQAGITLTDIDYIVFYEKPFIKFERIVETYVSLVPKGLLLFLKSMPLWIKDKLFQKKKIIQNLKTIEPKWEYNGENLLFCQHHHSHAASAFYPSPFEKALILILDGVGEWNTTTIALGMGNNIRFLKEINFPHSIGLLYSAFTYYLGFKVNCDEYKVMGLAPYGKPIFVDTIYKHLIDVKEDGSFRINLDYFGFASNLRMTNRKFHALFGANPRQKRSELTEFYMDMASSIQKVTEEVLLRLVNNLHKTYGYENLCLAGGVALNCVANGRILRESPFKNVWIQPAAGDAGGALGAAFAVYHEYLGKLRESCFPKDKMKNAFLGPDFSKSEIRELLIRQNLSFSEPDADSFYKTVAAELANGKIIGLFNGRMEFGPRALGARSIIADARNDTMQSIMNEKIKLRESFRPFAPAILEDHVSSFFDLKSSSPYMLIVANLLEKHRIALSPEENNKVGIEKLNQIRSYIPGVTHVDYSARIQTVNEVENSNFYKIISAFYTLTGCPVIINTSFNTMDEPIVCTPEDAIRCFHKSGIDILAIENLLVYKQ